MGFYSTPRQIQAIGRVFSLLRSRFKRLEGDSIYSAADSSDWRGMLIVSQTVVYIRFHRRDGEKVKSVVVFNRQCKVEMKVLCNFVEDNFLYGGSQATSIYPSGKNNQMAEEYGTFSE